MMATQSKKKSSKKTCYYRTSSYLWKLTVPWWNNLHFTISSEHITQKLLHRYVCFTNNYNRTVYFQFLGIIRCKYIHSII